MKEQKIENNKEQKKEIKKEKRIYPYLIKKERMQGYYEMLLDDGYEIKYFNKKNNREIYDFFLPAIRNYMFWTFNLINTKEFKQMSNDLMAVVCSNYECNIFQKDKSVIICFNTGVCFVITDNKKLATSVKDYREKKEMQSINLRDDESYDIFQVTREEKESLIYLYVLELYKMIYLEIIAKEIQNPNKFDRVREEFVTFTSSVYNVKITDNKEVNRLAEKIENTLELDKKYIKIDDEFDLMYKNNKLNDKKFLQNITLIVLVTAIILCVLDFLSKIF